MSKEKTLLQRMLGVMSDVDSVIKNETVNIGRGSYSAVSHDDVARLLHPVFVKHGIVCIPSVTDCEFTQELVKNKYGESVQYQCKMTCNVRLVSSDDPSDAIDSITHGFAFDSGDKAYGKAYSYAVKYALLKLFMLESRDAEEQRNINLENSVPLRPKVYTHSPKLIEHFTNFLKQTERDVTKGLKWMETQPPEKVKEYLNGK